MLAKFKLRDPNSRISPGNSSPKDGPRGSERTERLPRKRRILPISWETNRNRSRIHRLTVEVTGIKARGSLSTQTAMHLQSLRLPTKAQRVPKSVRKAGLNSETKKEQRLKAVATASQFGLKLCSRASPRRKRVFRCQNVRS